MARAKVDPEIQLNQRRLRGLTPENAHDKIIQKDLYWTTSFLFCFLDECDRLGLEDPAAGLELARVAPELAGRIMVDSKRPGQFASEREKRSALVMTWTVLGSLYRRMYRLSESESAYQKAFAVATSSKPVDFSVQSQLYRRYGLLRMCQGAKDASIWVEKAIAMAQDHSRSCLAEALLTRGYWHITRKDWPSASTDLTASLEYVDLGSRRGKDVLAACAIYIAYILAMDTEVPPTERQAALSRIQQLRSSVTRTSPARARLYWVEGLLLASLDFHGKSIRLLNRARKELQKKAQLLDFMLISEDLRVILRSIDRFEDEEILRKNTATAFDAMPGTEIAKARVMGAVSRWRPSIDLSVPPLIVTDPFKQPLAAVHG